MIDKMQKIKDWISKEQDGLMDANGNFEYPEHEGAFHILTNLDYYIDSLQEEPASSIWHDASEEPEEGKDFAFVTYNGIMWARYRIEDIFIGWQKYRIQTKLDKWAYVSDLLKL